MSSATRTLPLAASVPPGTIQRVMNYSASTTLNVSSTAGEVVGLPGVTSIRLGPLRAIDFQSDGVNKWIFSSDMRIPLTDAYTLPAAMISVPATPARVALARDTSASVWPNSSFFTVDGNGDLVAIRPFSVSMTASFVWAPNTSSNDDAGIILSCGLVSGTGSVITDNYGQLFQSSRPNTDSMGASHDFGIASLDEGDILGFIAASYAGQTGLTDLSKFRVYFDVYG
jgi:hypothetical protein